MPKRNEKNVIVDKTSTYGKKPPVVVTSQGTPEHNRDPSFTMSAHDKAELFIEQMTAQRLANIKHDKPKSKIQMIKKKVRGVKKKNGKKNRK